MNSVKGSSNIRGEIYEPRTGVLSIHFTSGDIWDYPNVSGRMHKEFMSAPSKGAWVAENLVRKPVNHPAKKREVKK